MTAETMEFSAEISKLLKLMIHSLYTNKDIFLRELISNASDACDKLRYNAIQNPTLLADDATLSITISIDKAARTVTIADNGIGMNREDLIKNLGTIARSGTQEFLEHMAAAPQTGEGAETALIGQFGVGFYSAYMVADRVHVTSRKAGEDAAWAWDSAGDGQFTVTPHDAAHPRGTRITLHLREGEDIYLDPFKLKFIATTYSDHIGFPIHLTDVEGKTETINAASALWVRPKASVTESQYKEFYHAVAHSPDTPWMTLHNKAEGTIEYTNLLFIPSIRPFDLFHPDRKRRVKLYVKRVFITDENVNLVPPYLRFLRGVIDSEDLPLNISRETLQKNPVLDKIRDAIEKRVLGELKKRLAVDPAEYEKFWENFGAVLKEGLCEAIAPKDLILEASCFHTLNAPTARTGLEDYVKNMKPGQENIYYLTGDNLDAMAKSPQVEGFRARGIDVLFLSDHVDDFWVNVVTKYKDIPFKSVTRATDDLEKIPVADAPKKPDEAPPETTAALVEYLKNLYGDAVHDVHVSTRLTDSAVCLSVSDMGMDIRMERFLVENKQLPSKAPKILEINPHHPVIARLSETLASGGAVDEFAWLLLDQARIQEGEELSDPVAFSTRLSALMGKLLVG